VFPISLYRYIPILISTTYTPIYTYNLYTHHTLYTLCVYSAHIGIYWYIGIGIKRGPHYCARVDTEKFDIIVGRLSVDISVATHNIVAIVPLCHSRRRDRKTIRRRRRGGFWLARSPRRQLRTY